MTLPGPAPPALGVKVNVALEAVFPATRSAAAIVNVTAVTAPPTTPDDSAADARASTLVCTVTSPPAVAAPMVKPESVTVMGEEAATAPVATVKAMELLPDVAALKVAPCAAAEIGVVPETKNPVG